jgi:AcrR family transcriptional regulator
MGIAERREREKEQRRNAIIDAAENVFFAKGLANATMDEVAEAVELSKGTIYLYFKSKEDLYLAIIRRGLTILRDSFVEALNTHEKGIEKIEAIAHPNHFQAMLYFESAGLPYDAESGYAAECHALSNNALEISAEAVRIGIQDGTIRPDLDPMKTAMTLYGVSVGLLQTAALKGTMMKERHDLDPNELTEYFFEFIGDSLRA